MSYLRTTIIYLWAVLVIVCMLPYLAYCNHRKEKAGYRMGMAQLYRLVWPFAQSIVALSGAKVTISGLEYIPQDEPVVLMGNHQSYFDIPLVVYAVNRPVGFMAKEELSKVPFFSPWIKGVGSVFLNREEGRKALASVLDAVKIVKNGHAIVIFPEGTRSRDGHLQDFKPGSAKIAQKAGAAILPFAITGARDVMPRDSMRFFAKEATITFLPPIAADVVKSQETGALIQTVKNTIADSLGEGSC